MQLMASLSWFIFQRKPSAGFLEIVGRTVITKRSTAESDLPITAEDKQLTKQLMTFGKNEEKIGTTGC